VGIDVKPTFATKYFHKWKVAYTPYKYIKPSPEETDVVLHQTSYKDV
jgi:hypothetical protein